MNALSLDITTIRNLKQEEKSFKRLEKKARSRRLDDWPKKVHHGYLQVGEDGNGLPVLVFQFANEIHEAGFLFVGAVAASIQVYANFGYFSFQN